ncbi:hypothetical protein RHGRI_029073 [Rhododendron griersonianum]|uniref:Uncharacterized protein n=1 Tax=Rhododendron griersonianum TaxID=479676 RepID=A0AAV6ILB8_9ERIC|nr:hypothetical protein RHGRI_029073 [Rhododendron griersonianum]
MGVHNGGSNVGINRVPSSPRGTNGKVSILPLVFLIFTSSEFWWIYSKLDEVVFLGVEHHFKRTNHVPNINCNAPEQGTSRVYILMVE